MKSLAKFFIIQLGILVFTVVLPIVGVAAEMTNSNLPATPNLSMRQFRIDTVTFSNNLQKLAGLQATNVAMMTKSYFRQLGVDFDLSGKSFFFNEKLGLFFVKATDRDLDYVASVIQRFNQSAPLIHIKSNYFEAPKGTAAGFGNLLDLTNSAADVFTGILNVREAGIVLNSLRSRKDVKMLFDPEFTTSGGRQVLLMPLTRTGTNIVFQERPAAKFDYFDYVNSFGWKVETNMVLSVVSIILPDGYTIGLEIIPSEAGYYAHDKPSGGHFTTLTVLDNQTVFWGGLAKNFMLNENGAAGKPDNDKELLVFITATIVDAAGNRVHSDDEIRSAQKGIPPHPK